jgi:glutamate-1-semialdehyde 2,1-aminomutase
MGVIPPEPGYLDGLRELTIEYGALLLFDEVMTGFRVSLGGAQARYRVMPDLTVLGKVIGGGLPVGAYGGPHEIMNYVSPVGPVYQAGTLAGNPLATAAGLATLDVLGQQGVVHQIEESLAALCAGLGELAKEAGVPVYQTRVGSMACMFFHDGPVKDYADATASDTDRYGKFFWGMLERGVYLAPSQFEAMFISAAHGQPDLDQTLTAAKAALASL